MKFAILPDSSGWRLGGHKETDYSASPSDKAASPHTVAGSPCRQAVSFYGALVSLRQAISYTKRFSNSTAFVKWKNQTWLSCKITVKNDLKGKGKGCQGFISGFTSGKDHKRFLHLWRRLISLQKCIPVLNYVFYLREGVSFI